MGEEEKRSINDGDRLWSQFKKERKDSDRQKRTDGIERTKR